MVTPPKTGVGPDRRSPSDPRWLHGPIGSRPSVGSRRPRIFNYLTVTRAPELQYRSVIAADLQKARARSRAQEQHLAMSLEDSRAAF
jgi:hypothetical protein